MIRFSIGELEVKLQFNEPTEDEIEEAEEEFNTLYKNANGSLEVDEFEEAMIQSGYMCSWDNQDQRFLFVPY